MSQKNYLADSIYRYRTTHKMSKAQLAERLRELTGDKDPVSDRAVTKWENNEAYPKTEHIIALSSLMGVTTDELLKAAIEDFKAARPASKTETLSPQAKVLLFTLCKHMLNQGDSDPHLAVYFKIVSDKNDVYLADDKFYDYYEAKEEYVEKTTKIYRVLRMRDFLSSSAHSLEELIKYMDIAILYTGEVLTPILYSYQEENNSRLRFSDQEELDSDQEELDSDQEEIDSDQEEIDSDQEEIDSDQEELDSDQEELDWELIEALFDKGEIEQKKEDAERKERLENPAYNVIYFQYRGCCLYDLLAAHLTKAQRYEREKTLLSKVNARLNALFGELFEKGILQNDSDRINILEFGDSCANDVEEHSVMHFYKANLKILLTSKEILDFLTERFREKTEKIIEEREKLLRR